MRHTDSSGNKVGYEVRGSGPPLLLCHGLLGDGSFWDPVAEFLEHSHRLIVVDMRGHRHSPALAPFTLWDMADDMIAIMDQEDVASLPVVGFSMGGMTALRMALKYPERVDALGIISSAARDETLLAKLRNLSLGQIVRFTGPLRIFEPVIKGLMFSDEFRQQSPAVVRNTMDTVRAQNGRSTSYAIRSTFTRESIVDKLDGISQPTLVMVGDKDRTTPIAWSRELHQRLKRSDLVVVPGVGHMAPVEAPEVVATTLSAWLSPTSG